MNTADATPNPSPDLAPLPGVEWRDEGDSAVLRLHGSLGLDAGPSFWQSARARDLRALRRVRIDLGDVAHVDGAIMALLVQLKGELEQSGADVEVTGAEGPTADLLRLYAGDVRRGPLPVRRPEKTLEQIGRRTYELVLEGKSILHFVGRMTDATHRSVRDPGSINWGAVLPLMERAGSDAVPIVLVINFLVGFVMAYQSAAQLKQFGANIFVADLIGLATVRELGPLMTAIVVAGRSGAAYAAELGSMKVSEEIDALQTMGFGPIRYLVFPRLIALIAMMPLLTVLADAMSIGGGLLVGLTTLDLTTTGFMNELQKAVHAWDFVSGLLKAAVFGTAVVVISCYQGLTASGGAEGVGRRTTGAVVAILFMLILIDAAFTIVFNAVGS